MARAISFGWLLLGLGAVLAACGKKDGPDPVSPGDSPEVQIIRREDPKPPPEGGAAAGETPKPVEEAAVSREEAARRARLGQLRAALEKAGDSDTRAEILGALESYGSAAKGMWPLIVAAMEDEEPFTRGQAVVTASAADPGQARPLIDKALADPDAQVRRMAVQAFEKGGYPDLDALIRRMRDEFDAQVQLSVLMIAERSGNPLYKPAVLEILDDLAMQAAPGAFRYLAKIKAADASGAVVPFLNRGEPDTRLAAVRSLQEMGDAGKPVLLALSDALLDEDVNVRRAANEALEAMTGEECGFTPGGSEEVRRNERNAWRTYINTRP